MSITSYDVIIIGTGPAGANAALDLASSGLKVLILEKASLPRHKPCGGAMPSSVQALINVDIKSVIANTTPIIELYKNYGDELLINSPTEHAPLLVLRNNFDLFLVQEAISRSNGRIVLREGCKSVFSGESKLGVTITINGIEQLETKYLIAADGANSRVASALKLLPNKKFAPALESEIVTSRNYYQAHANRMVMNLFCLPQGYGWIFPKDSNRFSCGVGAWGEHLKLRSELRQFIKQSIPGSVIESEEVKGYPIPVYQGTQTIATNRVLLTGDAAALVDPVSGEGIRYALLSGRLAAEAIIQDLRAPTSSTSNAGSNYQIAVDLQIGTALTSKLKFASLAFRASPDYFYNTFVKKQQKVAYTS